MNSRDRVLIYLLSVMLGSAFMVLGLTAVLMPHLQTNSEALRRWQQMIILDVLFLVISAVLYMSAKRWIKSKI